MNALAGLMDPSQIGAGWANAFQTGMQQAEQYRSRSALQDYMRAPSDETALQVGMYNPGLGMQLQDRETERRAAAQKQQQAQYQSGLQQRAASGDQGALAELAGIDLDAWSKLDTRQKAAIKQNTEYVGQAALAVSQLPEQQRPQAWDAYIQQGVQMGMADLAPYQGKYTPDTLNAVLANAGQMKTFLDMEQPDYRVVPEGGQLVDVNNPQAIEQSRQSGPKPGVVEEGYRFNGGDPANPNNWQQVGGAGGNASGNFRP